MRRFVRCWEVAGPLTLMEVGAERLVVEAGGMGEEVVDHDLLLPLALKVREILRDRAVQAQPALVDQNQGRGRRQRLADRGKGEDRVPGKVRRVGLGAELAERFVKDDDSTP